MLHAETKRKIDSLRDTLVGKIPVPHQQVEQITLALIYKFMSDIDEDNRELGGQSFFNDHYKQYRWDHVMDRKLQGHERVLLYSEGLEKMALNDHLPQLFRDIFKGAYLPFKDPVVFDHFLKGVNEFSYDHSEELGNAFEYLLSVMGSQGDAGQFRTPRHIIDFIVEAVDPTKDDTILDPACGTAGFLISAYKHILKNNIDPKSGQPGSALTATERQKLGKRITGYDISHEMVRLSLANLYLHGFPEPRIYEYDTLSSEERWNDDFSCILANPPFMTPRGGIQPHRRFSVQSRRAEVLFVDYIMEHLTPQGKAGVIVPEGIIFQSGTAYKQLRKMLVDEGYLYAVVSLPSGVFKPYAGVKTNILLIDRELARRTNKILYVEVSHDGFSLSDTRTPIDKNDLPGALEIIKSFKQAVREGANFQVDEKDKNLAYTVDKDLIQANDDRSLVGRRYLIQQEVSSHWPTELLGELCRIEKGKSPTMKTKPGPYPLVVTAEARKTADHFDFSGEAICVPLISSTGHGHASIKRLHYQIDDFALANTMCALFINDPEKLDARFLYHYLSNRKVELLVPLMTGAANVSMKPNDLLEVPVLLPPLSVQKEIVAQIDRYQKIIDGARQVIENWEPKIEVDPEWPMERLGEVCKTSSGGTPLKSKSEYYEGGNVPWLRSGEVAQGKIFKAELFITDEGVKNSSAKLFPADTVLVAMYGATAGQVGLLKFESTTNQAICGILPNDKFVPEFLYLYLKSLTSHMVRLSGGGAQPNISQKIIRDLQVPIPTIDIQQQIVNEIQSEEKAITENQKLIEQMERKIDQVLEKI